MTAFTLSLVCRWWWWWWWWWYPEFLPTDRIPIGIRSVSILGVCRSGGDDDDITCWLAIALLCFHHIDRWQNITLAVFPLTSIWRVIPHRLVSLLAPVHSRWNWSCFSNLSSNVLKCCLWKQGRFWEIRLQHQWKVLIRNMPGLAMIVTLAWDLCKISKTLVTWR